MQSLLGVDLFGAAHGADMKQISDKKEHQTQARIRGEYENREGPWRGACRGSDRGRERDGGAGGEAALVTEKGQQEAAADFGKAAGRGGPGLARLGARAAEALRVTWIYRNS